MKTNEYNADFQQPVDDVRPRPSGGPHARLSQGAGTHRLVNTFVSKATRGQASRRSDLRYTVGCANPNPDASAHSECALRPSKQPNSEAMTR